MVLSKSTPTTARSQAGKGKTRDLRLRFQRRPDLTDDGRHAQTEALTRVILLACFVEESVRSADAEQSRALFVVIGKPFCDCSSQTAKATVLLNCHQQGIPAGQILQSLLIEGFHRVKTHHPSRNPLAAKLLGALHSRRQHVAGAQETHIPTSTNLQGLSKCQFG